MWMDPYSEGRAEQLSSQYLPQLRVLLLLCLVYLFLPFLSHPAEIRMILVPREPFRSFKGITARRLLSLPNCLHPSYRVQKKKKGCCSLYLSVIWGIILGDQFLFHRIHFPIFCSKREHCMKNTLLSLLLCCYDKALIQSKLGGKGSYQVYSPFREARAGSQDKNLDEGTEVENMKKFCFLPRSVCLLSGLCSVCSFIEPRIMDGATHNGLCPPTIFNRENSPKICPQTNVMEVLSELMFPLPRWL